MPAACQVFERTLNIHTSQMSSVSTVMDDKVHCASNTARLQQLWA